MNKILVVIILTILIFNVTIWAQSYEDDPEYQKFLDLREQAEQLIADGYYDEAVELLEGNNADTLFLRYKAYQQYQKAQEYLGLAVQYKADEMFPEEYALVKADLNSADSAFKELKYEESLEYSNKVINQCKKFEAYLYYDAAKNRIAEVDSFNGDETNPDEYANATERLQLAEDMFMQEEYAKSINYSKSVLSELEDVKPEQVAVVEPNENNNNVPDNTNQISETDKAVLPKYYVVRLIPANRDCLNKIAGYDFVYGDPAKWQIIWEANKDVLKDPDNPHFILPGQILEIPSIGDETREGTYIPE